MNYCICKRHEQKGAALLLFALLLIVGSTYTLILKLNSDTNFYTRQSKETQESLRLAKQGLIGYALMFPEKDAESGDDAINGPGYLPCPDTDNNGTAAGSCSAAGKTTIGRFPYKTLELPELRDASGNRLWYALSDNYRNNPALEPLNSETKGQLAVDNNNDIVAVVIAPGAPIGDQNREPGETDIPTEIADYLENVNNNLDTDFIATDPDPIDPDGFNDFVVSITRQELMRLVEKRVLGEVRVVLSAYKTENGAYPWLSVFADPKAVASQLIGTADSGSSSNTLMDSTNNFLSRGVTIGDTIYNTTDGSVGAVSVVGSGSLNVTGLILGENNDINEDDKYVIIPQATANSLSGTASKRGGNDTLSDNKRNLRRLGAAVGDVVDNITDGSSAMITSISEDSLGLDGLAGGTDNQFQMKDTYQIRNNYGVATNATINKTQLVDASKDFIRMGIRSNDIIGNISDGSIGRIINVAENTLTVDALLFGKDNLFEPNDRYVIPRYNPARNVREGLLGIHEVGKPFKTDLDFDWAFTAAAGDTTINNSDILQDYLNDYIEANSQSFKDDVGICVWFEPAVADCFASKRDFVRISGNITSGSNTHLVTDSNATFKTDKIDKIKPGDIVQNYDHETLVASGTTVPVKGTATSNSHNLTLEDIDNNFINTPIAIGDIVINLTDLSSGFINSISPTQITVSSLDGAANTDKVFSDSDDYQIRYNSTRFDAYGDFSAYKRYNYVVQNETLASELDQSKIQGVLADVIDSNTLEVEPYVGEGTEPIRFRSGDRYHIYEPKKFVVKTVSNDTQLTTVNYQSSTSPDFNTGDYYRIIPAARSLEGTVPPGGTSSVGTLKDNDAAFLEKGVEVGAIIENHAGAFGEISSVTRKTITTTLYGGDSNDFSPGEKYTIYYDHVFSREHTIRARFRGDQHTKTVSEERKRDVCLGYNNTCTSIDKAVAFSGNGGEPLVTIIDYQEDEVTEVGNASFMPSPASTGSLRVSNINFYLDEVVDDFPEWFLTNNWHKLIYVAISKGDAPGSGVDCDAGTNCLTLTGAGNPDDKEAIVIAAGRQLESQDRAEGATIDDYLESNNSTPADDNFQEQFATDTFNDQVRVVTP